MIQSPLLVEKKREALTQGLLALGEEVATALAKSLEALRTQDLALAREVVDGDASINLARRILEQEAVLALAAYQPAGSDLRRIAASLELVAELERIGDYAADVARILLREEWGQLPGNLTAGIAQMGDAALGMFRDALRAYTREGGDEALARAVAARDDQVDALQRAALDAVVDLIRDNPAVAAPALALSWIAHYYERVADRATNIAERVVYLATGEIPDLN
ncbi:phosphate signaling complex protein PhoU [uncultured Thiodictyon sp.]|jgi:phosphate transport system protein|uniref:phosphate signaling complex protein PhoU n=1 Tax=uncultured Thiodictyon sp. TaxID=1846217 RepID=UPI0025CC5E73|nr:phosphate signaling complex protein PhoU [uncultured Thiodictyon sp.]